MSSQGGSQTLWTELQRAVSLQVAEPLWGLGLRGVKMYVPRSLKYSLRWGELMCAEGAVVAFDLSAPVEEVQAAD